MKMKILLIQILLLLTAVTVEEDICIAQLNDLFFYKMMPLPCNNNDGPKIPYKKSDKCKRKPLTKPESDWQVQMDCIIGLINFIGEFFGDSSSRLKEQGVSLACMKKMQEHTLEAFEKGEWIAFSVFENGSVYEVRPVVPIFHHHLFKMSKPPEFKNE